MADVERLEHIRDLLTRTGHDARDATLALYSLLGSTTMSSPLWALGPTCD